MPSRRYDFRRVESRWRQAWAEAGCFRAPDTPTGEKYFNYDSGPFPSGPLHMGHVRTYVLGDMTARYQRLLGRSVLYATEFDSFGLPNEMAALTGGQSPAEAVAHFIDLMTGQLKALGISYDWDRIPTTSDPSYYRWTQWLFLKLLSLGLVERREAELTWCETCQTTLARIQSEGGRCWRCQKPTGTRRLLQWFVKLSAFSAHLRRDLRRLEGWSERSLKLLEGFIGRGLPDGEAGGWQVHDWMISRQRCWGAPIPVVHCEACGCVPVPEGDLPVRLPDDLDWSLGPGALAAREDFVKADCPRCKRPARRDIETLDCYFDDIWCFLGGLTSLDRLPFRREALAAWMPVDRFHSGLDTFFYLHLHRFLGMVLQQEGVLDSPEPIRTYLGHEMVLLRGRKMSKHLGNGVSPKSALRKHGADALRVAILRAAGPARSVVWRDDLLERGVTFVDEIYALYRDTVPHLPPADGSISAEASQDASRAAVQLWSATRIVVERVGHMIDAYRPHTALRELDRLQGRIRRFAEPRLASRRLSTADAATLRSILLLYAIALSPFAPFLAEELGALLGQKGLICQARWPGPPA